MVNWKKLVTWSAILFFVALICVYVTFFRHPPADVVLLNNKGSPGKKLLLSDPAVAKRYEQGRLDAREQVQLHWDTWVEENGFIAIGKFYEFCDEEKAKMLGVVLLLEDEVYGGVKSHTYFNLSLENALTEGSMYIDVKYNGKQIFKNKFDLCTVDKENLPCPIPDTFFHFEYDVKIPSYIPKGRYQTKAWLVDQLDKVVGCAFCDFTI